MPSPWLDMTQRIQIVKSTGFNSKYGNGRRYDNKYYWYILALSRVFMTARTSKSLSIVVAIY